MSGGDEDDKPTVIIDLNALKKQKLSQEEDLANLVDALEFTGIQPAPDLKKPSPKPKKVEPSTEDFASEFLNQRDKEEPSVDNKNDFPVILFDLNSDFFQKSLTLFPEGYEYKVVNNVNDLNTYLRTRKFQIIVLNYDQNPKAANVLSAQIKQKFPNAKALIMAKAISPEKAQAHAKTASGASGYYQFPLVAEKIEKEFKRIKGTK